MLFSLKTWLHSWFEPRRPVRRRKTNSRYFAPRSFRLECLEDRTMLSGVSVNLDTSYLQANATAIVINGSGFSPIVAKNTVTFDNHAMGTVTAATTGALTVALTTDPTSAGPLDATVAVTGGGSAANQVATIQPVVTTCSDSLPANATTLTISGFGFDPTSDGNHNSVSFDNGTSGTVTGTVTSATATALTVAVDLSSSAAGPLSATVTSNTVVGTETPVATIIPVVTSSITSLDASSGGTLTINGIGFDGSINNDNQVTFDNGATGTVTSATGNALTVTVDASQSVAGALNAVVSSNGVSSGVPVQVATIQPVVTVNSASIDADAATLTITGSGFDPTAGSNLVSFDDGASGTVIAATTGSLTVSLDTPPTSAGEMDATVTTDYVPSAQAEVAAIQPVVTSSTANVSAGTATLTINGFGFDAGGGTNTVTLNGGSPITATNVTSTSLDVALPSNLPVGVVSAVVTTDAVDSNSGTVVQVATIVPAVTTVTTGINADAATLTINGFGFDTTPGNNAVAFNNGALGHVTAATATTLTVTFDTQPTGGNLYAVVTTDTSYSSSTPIQVATVAPVVTTSSGSLPADSTTLTIQGTGFDLTPSNNVVSFGDSAVGTVTAVNSTGTALTVTFSTMPATAGDLDALVTTNSQPSNGGTLLKVATVTPFVTSSEALLSDDAATLIINGYGFDSTASQDTVLFNDGAAGTVGPATATSLTVTLTTPKTSAGPLTVVVTTDGQKSNGNTPIQVAAVSPVVYDNTGYLLPITTPTLTIYGSGFTGSNTVAFNDGATGHVTASASDHVDVTFDSQPTTAGPLTAIVTSSLASSGTAVTVATVAPSVTPSSGTAVLANATTVTIGGSGFDPTAGNNRVQFNDSAVGTVTTSTATTLTVSLSTPPTTAGPLTAVVTTNNASSGAPVTVGTVQPVITPTNTNILAGTSTVTITGAGFDMVPSRNTVSFTDGATGVVTAVASPNSLTATFSVKPTTANLLTASVTTDSVSSGTKVEVAALQPVVSTNPNYVVAANAGTVIINGSGFDTTTGHDVVTFYDGATGSVEGATANALTVTFNNPPAVAGPLTATVSVNNVGSGAAVTVGKVTPVVTPSSGTGVAVNATTLTIAGSGFSTVPTNDTVVFNDALGNTDATGHVTTATANSLTVAFDKNPTIAGLLSAIVTTNTSYSSGAAVGVATIDPLVTSTPGNSVAANATTVIITGSGFDTVKSHNTVTFDNGAVGTVTAVNSAGTSLTVTFSVDPGKGGALDAAVTTDGASSGSQVQVASVVPAITTNTALVSASAASVTINGYGFDSVKGNDSVTLDGLVASIGTATANQLIVALPEGVTAGALDAVVTVHGVSNSTPAQVATIAPVVDTLTTGIATNAPSLTITGYGFNPTSDTVSLNGGVGIAATNIVMGTSGNPDSLQVALPGSLPAGNLTAVITAAGINSGSAVQVATVDPVVTTTAGNSLLANAATVTITGIGFDAVSSHNTVTFDNGAAGTVTAVNSAGTLLTVTFTVNPGVAGALDASVSSDGASSGGLVQVATVAPVVLSNALQIVAADAPTITINGFGFDAADADTVTLNGISGTISSATANQLIVDLPSGATTATGVTAGALDAVVTVDGVSSGNAVQVDTIIPVVTQAVTSQGANVNTLTITGYGFDPSNTNTVVLNDAATVSNVTATDTHTLSVTLSKTPSLAGNLTATVMTDLQSNGAAVQVATITPAITSNPASMAPNQTTLDIHGYGFDTVYYDNAVSFDDGAVGAVSAVNSSGTDLTVTFSVEPPAVGTMDAVVTTDSLVSNSGTAVQVATVTPTITSSTASLAANAGTLTINGLGFIPSPNYSENLVSLDNGAASGIVTAASATSLTVSLPDNLPAGSLTAVVTSNSFSNNTAVQVATVVPAVTSSQTSIASNTATLTISGYGFDATAGNNMVSLNGATAIAASSVSVGSGGAASSLHVTLPGNLPVGSLTAVVTTDTTYSSGPAVQVATITPGVPVNQATIASNATTLTISGYGFDATPGNNMVSLDGAAAIAASSVSVGSGGAASSLTVSLPGNLPAGSLTAVVTTDTTYSSGPAVQVATVAPYVTPNTSNPVPANTATLTITGYGFDSTAANNTVAFNGGTPIAASRFTAGSGGAASSLQVTLPGTLTAGNLMVVVMTHGVSSSSTQVATLTPVVTSSSATVALNATSVVINGYGFDPAKANDSVQFNGVAAGTVTAATANSLTVTFGTKPAATGSLTAIVTTGTQNSGSAVPVATVVAAVTVPTVTNGATTTLLANANSLTITGSGFDAVATNNRLSFNDGAVGTVTGVNSGKTALTVQLTTLPTTAGALSASVITDGVSSGAAVQVATVKPVVSSSGAALGINATQLTINGFGFDPTKGNDSVTLYSGGSLTGVSATITGTPTATSLTVTPPAGMALGNLTAAVTVDTESSGTAVQVATVRPVVTASAASVAVGASGMTISGFGFSTTATSNVLSFNNGVTGTVSSSTANTLNVTFGSVKPTTLGPLTVTVSTGGIADSSATPVTVGTVVPVVTLNSGGTPVLGANQITISGSGFDPANNGANNSVQFNLGVTGTVTAGTATSLTVTFNSNGKPALAGNLTATVTTDTSYVSSTTQVATIAPTVTRNTSNPLPANTTSITLGGSGFDPNGTNTVSLNGGTPITATNVTGTSLQVALPSTLTAGNLMVVVTTNGAASTSTQVATLTPVVNSNTSNPLAANAGTLTIGGSGFDTVKTNDTVTLYSGGSLTGVTATITGTPTSTSISVTPPAGMAVGNLTAKVAVGSQNSGTIPVQVATVVPAVTANLSNPLALGASQVTISGAGFDTASNGVNNSVQFNLGVTGTVSAATATSLTVTLNNKPAIAGNLTATVTTDNSYVSNTAQVATIAPTVNSNASNPLPANTASITISGSGFASSGTNTVSLNGGTPIAATNVTGTSLQVALPTTLTAGNLMVVVTTNGVASTSMQVATLTPVVTGSQADLPCGATSMVINGFGFDATTAHDTLAFNNGVSGTVSSATANTLNVTFGASAKPTTGGSLTVTVITDQQSSGITPVQVATVVPVITSSNATLAFNSSTVTIGGTGFSATKSSDIVTLDGVAATVNTASTTSLQVALPAGLTVGNLMTVVTIGTASSTSTQVATLTPVVTGGTPSTLALGASSITINGFGFDTTNNGAHNTVQFNLGVTGQVSAATANTLTVTLNNKPATAGDLTAIVTTDTSYSSGTTGVQVATIAPSVTGNTNNKLAANAATVTINGSGFSTTLTLNSVKLNGVTAAINSGSASQLVVAIPAGLSAGNLMAVVTSNGVAGSSTQVATLTPVVTPKTTSVAHTVATLTIYGYGFDTTTASNNTVVFTFSTGATVTGHVIAATAATSSAAGTLTVTYDTKPTTAGTLSAVVTTDLSYSSAATPVVVATIT